jgi:hypothetical protein
LWLLNNSIVKHLLLLFFLPALLVAQEKPICLKTEVELDTVEVYNTDYFLGRVSETYAFENAIHLTGAFVLAPVSGETDKPLLFYSTLMKDTALTAVFKRLRSVSWPSQPRPEDTIQFGEVIDQFEISQLYHNIFEISHNQWQYYPGAAHGYGHGEAYYFDVSEDTFFDFDAVFESEVYPFLQEKLKANIKAEREHWEIDDDEENIDNIAEANYELGPGNYSFSYEGLLIQAQMYEKLFGWIEMGYNYYGLEIPWSELQPYLKPGNPLEKMLE